MIEPVRSTNGPVVARGIPILPTDYPIAVKIPKPSFKKKNIVLWVPGTNDHLIPPKFQESVKQIFGDDVEIILVDYPATQAYLESRAIGGQILRGTLDYIRANSPPGTKVYIGSLSQGSMVTGEVLNDPKYMGMVERAALMGHPGISHHHYDYHPKVREYNNMFDQTTVDWAEDKDAFVLRIERFLKGDIWAGVTLLGTILSHPVEALMAGLVNLYRVPLLNFPKLFPRDVHDYTESMDEAASWLYHGKIT